MRAAEAALGAGVLRPGPGTLELVLAQGLADGLAGHLAGPGPVGAVEASRVVMAVAARAAAGPFVARQAPGQARPDLGQLGPDLPAPGVAADLGPIRFAARSIGRTLSPPTQAKPPPVTLSSAARFASLQRRVTWLCPTDQRHDRVVIRLRAGGADGPGRQRPCGTSVSQTLPHGQIT